MNKRKLFIIFVLILFKLFTIKVYSQIDLESKNHFIWFDNVVGDGNLGIYNGTKFIEKYKTKPNNHRFLLDNTFRLGNLIYDNQTYYNIPLKYDIHDDQLIAKLPYQSNFLFVKLIKEKVDFFEINVNEINFSQKKLSFINSVAYSEIVDFTFKGFYQILLKNKTAILLKKNFKEKSVLIENNLAFVKFSDKSHFAILKDNKYYKINSKKDVIKVYPKQKRYISIFYRRNRKLFNLNESVFYTNLFRDIYSSISKNKK